MRKTLAMFALLLAGFWSATAAAAASPMSNLAAWVSRNTDLAVSQIAITGPENIYSLEPLGPRLPTGEVLALVRTEAVSTEWRAAHRFQSWDAHMLFDCRGGRARLLRSASYLERDRGGPAKEGDSEAAWFSPEANSAVATLLAAACDPSFAWPLRDTSAGPSKLMPNRESRAVQPSPAGEGASASPPNGPARAGGALRVAPAVSEPVTNGGRLPLILVVAGDSGRLHRKPRALRASPAPSLDPAPVGTEFEEATPVDLTQVAFLSRDELKGPPLQKVSFATGPRPATPAPISKTPVTVVDGLHTPVLAATGTGSAAFRRRADAGRGGFWRRIEVAWSHLASRQLASRSPARPAHSAKA